MNRGCWVREGTTTATVPFWDRSGATTVTACAIEAQARDVNPATMQSCETSRFMGDRSCGCGVGFRRCEYADNITNVQQLRINAVDMEPQLITDSVVRRGEDYFNILTTRRSFLNSTLSQFYRENQGNNVWAVTPQASLDTLPNIDFTADPSQWVEYTRDENNSGVLTTPEYLYRFPTYRSRVNQFYGAFLCKAFAPPADAQMPAPDDPCNRENNLSKRCGCTYCHATIEPTGAHWGRYGERNATYLDPALYPKFSAKCRDCALAGNTTCDGACANYVMQASDGDGASSLGLLASYLYRTPDEEPNITGGPALLVQRMMQTGDLERCAVQNIWNEFLGRPMTTQEQSMYMDSITSQWTSQGRSMKSLIKLLIDTDAYRRIRLMRRALFVLLAVAACNKPPVADRSGSLTPVDTGNHPPITMLPDPDLQGGHVGRAPRRLTVAQLKNSILITTGRQWSQIDTLAPSLGAASTLRSGERRGDPAQPRVREVPGRRRPRGLSWHRAQRPGVRARRRTAFGLRWSARR